MKQRDKRIETIITLIEASSIKRSPRYNSIKSEFQEVSKVSKVTPNTRRNLLRIVHSTRGLDSCIRAFLDNHTIRNGKKSLGGYLKVLTNHPNGAISKIPNQSRKRYQKSIVDLRNIYMHNAGKVANNSAEIENLLSEMESCVTDILRLE